MIWNCRLDKAFISCDNCLVYYPVTEKIYYLKNSEGLFPELENLSSNLSKQVYINPSYEDLFIIPKYCKKHIKKCQFLSFEGKEEVYFFAK